MINVKYNGIININTHNWLIRLLFELGYGDKIIPNVPVSIVWTKQ